MKPVKYGKWTITFNLKPIPDRSFDFEAIHQEYNGPDDNRFFCGASIEELMEKIDDIDEELAKERFWNSI